jgi:integrase
MPQHKLNEAFVRGATVEKGADRTIWWDTHERAPRGFGLMVTAGGARSWVIQYRFHGTSRRMTLPRELTLDKARAEAKKKLANVDKTDPLEERRENRRAEQAKRDAKHNTFRAVAQRFLDDPDNRELRSLADRRATFNRLVYPSIGNLPIEAITRRDVRALIEKIAVERGSEQANVTLAYVRRVFTWHADKDDDFALIRLSKLGKERKARDRVLNDNELRLLWRACEETPGPFGRYCQLLLLTMARRNEAAGLTRAELHGDSWIIPAARYKSKPKARHDFLLPLSKRAKALLDAMPVIGSPHGFVFTSNGQKPLSGFSPLKRALDQRMRKLQRQDDRTAPPLPRWTLHDLRRTGRTLMSRAGVNADHAERAMGHAIGGVRQVYDVWRYEPEKRAAFEQLAALIERIVNPPADNVVALPRGTQ